MSQYRCPECGYLYDEEIGDNFEGFAPGTAFDDLPSGFACPDCSVRDKEDFEKIS
jgi:rubredoxin